MGTNSKEIVGIWRGVRHLGMGQKLPKIHYSVDKTMNMCESYITKTYLKNLQSKFL
jgi:hypothetical protein